MLQAIREKISGWIALFVIGVIGLVFVFWGIDFQAGAIPDAARVNGERITADAMLRAWQQRQAELQQMLRSELPPELVRSQQEALLDERIRVLLLTQRANELGYRVSDEDVVQTILSYPELQVDGQFSRDRYAAILRAQGLSEAQFESELRTNLALAQLQQGIAVSAFVTPRELERRRALEGEQREVGYVVVPAEAFAAAVNVTDADIQAWYDDNSARYMTPEAVDLEYIDLRLADVESGVEVTEEALRAYYEQVRERFETQERRRARHILVEVSDQLDDAAARERAEEILARIRAGEAFEVLAGELSQDPGSAQQGGDLGWSTRGMFVGPFEDAIFGMSVGELRGPVQTQFGYHVIRLDEIDAGQQRPFEEVRAELEGEFRADRAQALFYERGQRLADESFASLTDLAPVAAALGMEIGRVAGFTRQGGGELGSVPEIIEAAFSPEVTTRGQNSPLIAVGDDRALVLRATDYHPPQQRPLAEVRDEIASLLRANAAQDAAARRGNEVLTRLESGSLTWTDAAAELARDIGVEPAQVQFIARQEPDVPPDVAQAAFSVPRSSVESGVPRFLGSALESGDFAVVAVTAVRSGNAQPEPDAERIQRNQQTAQQLAAGEFAAYLAELERNADVERNLAVFQ